MKTRGTELQQAISELAVEAAGLYGFLLWLIRWRQAMSRMSAGAPVIAPAYFNKRKATIYAGSNEIQRNIIAKAVLGL